ncbi:hypothetical protein PG990_001786 [Apiospora arundinis]
MEDTWSFSCEAPWCPECLGFSPDIRDVQINQYTPSTASLQQDQIPEDLSEWALLLHNSQKGNQAMILEPYVLHDPIPTQSQPDFSKFISTRSSPATFAPDPASSLDNYSSTITHPTLNDFSPDPTEWTRGYVDNTISFINFIRPSPYSYQAVIGSGETSSPATNTSPSTPRPPASATSTLGQAPGTYTCSHCPRNFTKRFQLTIHVRRHTRPIRVPCGRLRDQPRCPARSQPAHLDAAPRVRRGTRGAVREPALSGSGVWQDLSEG